MSKLAMGTPSAFATFKRSVIVGTLLPVSIWLSMARLTPASLARRSREWPCRVRRRFRLAAMMVRSAADGSGWELAPYRFPRFDIAMSADQLTGPVA